ncbi:hypothetical protein Scep_009337 [Stephania cephalantha]|uniref:Uncharacterized protein n=1 Tax=Stephania cephalantha TaxID=152367 RepID=A0AAP0JSY5_9MAGN
MEKKGREVNNVGVHGSTLVMVVVHREKRNKGAMRWGVEVATKKKQEKENKKKRNGRRDRRSGGLSEQTECRWSPRSTFLLNLFKPNSC